MTDPTPQSALDADPGPLDLTVDSEQAPSASLSSRRRVRAVVTPLRLLSLALIGMTVTAAAFGWQVRADNRLEDVRREVVAIAGTYAVEVTSYDHTTLDADFARVLEKSTGAFLTEFTAASESLRPLITRFKGSASGVVLSSGVLSADSESAEIVLFVDQTVRNTNSPETRIDRSRMRMGLEKQGGRWLISSLSLV